MGKSENPICKTCPIFEKCEIRKPQVAKWGYEPDEWDHCAFFTCLPALRHAGKELNSGRPFKRYKLPGGSTIVALTFDTPDKETRFFSPRKVVSIDGTIYGETEAGFRKTGQKTFPQ